LKVRFDIILVCTALVCVTVCVGVGLVGSGRERSSSVCKGIKVSVLDSAENRNLNSKEIIRLIDRDFGGYVNRPIDSVNLFKVEKILSAQKCLESCQAYFTEDGMLNLEITQSVPVLKIRHMDSTVAYLNRKAETFQVHEDWCNSIPEIKATTLLEDPQWACRMAALAEYICNSPLWKNKISDLECSPSGDVCFMVSGKSEIFEFGQPTDIYDKFGRINTYLEKIAGKKEYNKVSLNNKGQIVCK